jgi:hypothetical protein
VTEGGRSEVLRPDKPRFTSADGKVVVLFGWEQRPAAPGQGPLHQLRVGDGPAVGVDVGGVAKLGDLEVKVLRFLPQFTYDMQTKSAISLGDEPKNPAIEVEIKGKKSWLFARMPGFAHGGEGANLVYTFGGEKGVETAVLVGGADRSVVLHTKKGDEPLSFKEGMEVAGLKLARLLQRAEVTTEHATASAEQRHPAALFEVNNAGQLMEGLLVANERQIIQIGGGLFLTYETRGDDVKSFRSQIGIASATERRSAVVAVNDPIDVAGWKLYQVNYDPKDPTYSGLEAVRDPGVSWVFTGFGLIFAGVIYMIYAAPRFKKRPREALSAA